MDTWWMHCTASSSSGLVDLRSGRPSSLVSVGTASTRRTSDHLTPIEMRLSERLQMYKVCN
jgi:hypothetical protein